MQSATRAVVNVLGDVEDRDPSFLDRMRGALAGALQRRAEREAALEQRLVAACSEKARQRVQTCALREGPAAAHRLAVRLGKKRLIIERRRAVRKGRARRARA